MGICSQNLLPFVKSFVIDKEKKFTPKRIVWRKSQFSSVYTDHFSIEVTLSGMPRRTTLSMKSSRWNLGKPEGWKCYQELTEKAAEKIEEIVLNDEIGINDAMKKVTAIDNQIKFSAFGKTRDKSKKARVAKVAKQSSEETDNLELIRRQSQKMEDEVIRIKSQNLGRAGSIFKMKEVINGPKKGGQEPTAIKNPITGELVVSNEEIKKVTLAYCVDNLTKKSTNTDVEKEKDLRKTVHELRMKEEDTEELEIGWKDFEEVLKKFGLKKTKSYDFLLKSGKRYQEVMFKFCKKMISTEEFPLSFNRTVLYMIWKQKGPAEILKNSRFIHMKDTFLPRLCEALVVGKMKQVIINSSSKYQIGGQPGHATDEHIFTVKCVWARLEKENTGMIITLVDIVAFFDREDMFDVMETLHKIGVNRKAARVWYQLNKDTEISVKTASGMTDTALVGDCIGQGTAGGALVSQANLDQGLMEHFENSSEEIDYGNVKLQPLAYQDDILKGSKDVLDAKVGNIRLAAMLDSKGLEAHPDKTCFIVCGSKSYKDQVTHDLHQNSMMFGKFAVKQREYDRYLGQVLHGGGLDESALATVKERSGRIKGAALEIKSIIEEFQMQCIGGMMAAWELWEKALVPSLLSGAGTWFGPGHCKDAIELCDKIQNFFWRVVLAVPESCPKLALRCETGMIGMKWRIWEAKLNLLMRIKNHNTSVLCRQVYEEGRRNGWPGLWEEVREICEVLGLPDMNEETVTKSAVRNAIFENHYSDLKSEMEKSTGKLEPIKNEDFRKVQNYFSEKSIHTSRMAFRIRSQMVKEIPGNMKNKYKNKVSSINDSGLICKHCSDGAIMTQGHCMVCPAWEKLRVGLDLKDIRDLVIFFKRLLDERAKLEKESV